jgi:hypothetical protein
MAKSFAHAQAYCACKCHRRAGAWDNDGRVVIVLPPKGCTQQSLAETRTCCVPVDDAIEAVSACALCEANHSGPLRLPTSAWPK